MWGESMRLRPKKKPTLMPVVALAALGLMVALPTLSSNRLYAASAQRYVSVTVQSGDTLWSIASSHSGQSGDVQDTVDGITAANHLRSTALQPGQRLRIPQ